MTDSLRAKPYVWTSWITKLLAGDDECEWKSWYKAHYRYAKREDDGPELEAWIRQHDEMTSDRVAKLEANGATVHVEEANAFKLEGSVATLAGKPDIVAIQPEKKRAFVIDEKSGKRRLSDFWQVFVYLFALPLAKPEFRAYELAGKLEYRSGLVDVPSLDEEHTARISEVMRLVGGDVEPERVPSVRECRFCNVLNCPDRATGDVAVADATGHF